MKNTNKKIAIITYHRPINYGAILQVYALQKKIKDSGYNCVVLDYRNEKIENQHQKIKLSNCKSFKDLLKYIVLSSNINQKYDKFRKFMNQNMDVSRPLHDINEIKEIVKEFHKVITGSDQVWNYKINDVDPVYFLNFITDSSKKGSYAASFGVSDIPEELKNRYKELLKDFSMYLVRENEGAKIVKEMTGKDAQVVLDPTLLIEKDEWYKVANDDIARKYKYILVYAFGGSQNIMNLAQGIAKVKGYKIIRITNKYNNSMKVKSMQTTGPEEFLELFKNAELIITNSFHGTAFSINFNKQFYTELLPKSRGTNSRMEDILRKFNLQNRIIDNSDVDSFNTMIDYEKVNKILEKEREVSLELLRQVLS